MQENQSGASLPFNHPPSTVRQNGSDAPSESETSSAEVEASPGQAAVSEERSLQLGAIAQQIIAEQHQRIFKQEKKVLADKDPEPLHQMRVGLRRLRTALNLFDSSVILPKIARSGHLRVLARVLGHLRDLDVQIATLRQEYHPQLNPTEQAVLGDDLNKLQKQRRKAFADVEAQLTRTAYKDLKAAYQSWLEQPQFKPLAQLSLQSVLPDLLTPLVSQLLLHPGWLISDNYLSPENAPLLHDLRKCFKHVRYQAEFFTPFYGQGLQEWIEEVRTVQDSLGTVQDGNVLLTLLTDELHHAKKLPQLQATIHQTQEQALSQWEAIRQKYLNSDFRYSLHSLILSPQSSLE